MAEHRGMKRGRKNQYHRTQCKWGAGLDFGVLVALVRVYERESVCVYADGGSGVLCAFPTDVDR